MYDFKNILSEYGLTIDTYEQLLKDCSDKTQKISDLDWSEICAKYNLDFNPDTLRKGCQPPLVGSSFVSEYYKWKESNSIPNDNYQESLEVQRRELEKERKKIQTEKVEYNKWLREESRDELILEKITNAIANLPPLDIPKVKEIEPNPKTYVLAFGDEHYGVEFELKDVYGTTINSYSPEIFEERMWLLLSRTVELIRKEKIDMLHVFNLGDFCDGILRVSQLMKLRYGVVDSTIYYSEFICKWLNELTRYTKVKFQMAYGNHSELRMIGQPKSTFAEDNMGKIVKEFIRERLKDNPNFCLIDNPAGLIFANVSGYTTAGIHGETKNMANTLKDLSMIHQVHIDYLIAGHLHHSKSEEIGYDCEVINIPSIVGVDPYAISFNKNSNAAAKLFVFETAFGKTCEYTIKLN